MPDAGALSSFGEGGASCNRDTLSQAVFAESAPSLKLQPRKLWRPLLAAEHPPHAYLWCMRRRLQKTFSRPLDCCSPQRSVKVGEVGHDQSAKPTLKQGCRMHLFRVSFPNRRRAHRSQGAFAKRTLVLQGSQVGALARHRPTPSQAPVAVCTEVCRRQYKSEESCARAWSGVIFRSAGGKVRT